MQKTYRHTYTHLDRDQRLDGCHGSICGPNLNPVGPEGLPDMKHSQSLQSVDPH